VTESARPAPVLTVETTEIADFGALIPRLDRTHPLLWQRRGFGLAGIGEVARFEFSGPTRVADAASVWQDVVAKATVNDPLARTAPKRGKQYSCGGGKQSLRNGLGHSGCPAIDAL